MFINPVQLEKAWSPIAVTLLGIIVFLQPVTNLFVSFSIIALQLSLLSYTVFFSFTFILVNPEPANVYVPICFIFSLIVILVIPVHPVKA